MADKSRHAFGSSERIQEAIAAGALRPYDVLFLEGGVVGWLDGDGNVVLSTTKTETIVETKIETVKNEIAEESKDYTNSAIEEAMTVIIF